MEHVLAHHLIYEEGIPVYRMLQGHQVEEADEGSGVWFFTLLMNRLQEAGYEHYEISNFYKPEMYSRHNTSYRQGTSYLGCGPSAHSFDGAARKWSCSSIEKCIAGIESGKRDLEREERDLATRYNELAITSVRIQWGISLERLHNGYGTGLEQYYLKTACPSSEDGKLETHEGALYLTREGIFIPNSVMSGLLRVDN